MLLPSLFQLVVKSVAQQIYNEKIPLDFHLDTKSSNAVVRELLELDPTNIKKLKIYKNQLSSLTELDLSECEIADNEISHFKNFKLKSLEFGPLFHMTPDFPGPTSSDKINIVSLIKRTVNADSRKTMVHFGFSGEEDEYISGWEEKVSKLLPYLQSIKIIHMEFNERFQFSKFCSSFPNLRVLDISFAENLTTLKGIKRLKHLQKLVMREVEIEDVDGYNELSELKNLRFLDVSDEHDQIIRRLLEAEVRMENLEFLDCSMTCVQEHVLEEFVKCHPKLTTVVAISTGCNDLYIPTIDLLNFNSPYSTVKSLEYALSNDQYELAEDCLNEIMEKLNTIHEQLNESEIRALLNSVCCVLRETKDESNKHLAIHCFAESSFFQTERFFKTFWLEIPGIVERIFKSWKHFKSEVKRTAVPSILSIFEQVVNFLRFGKISQDRLLNFIMDKTVELSCQYPENIQKVTSILVEAPRLMSGEQYIAMCNNKKVIEGLFDFAHKLITFHSFSYQQIMEIIVRYLNQSTKNTLNNLVSKFQAVEKCYEQVLIISQFPSTDSPKNLSKIVLRLINVINPNVPDEKTKALVACLIFSLLLTKNLVDNREFVNRIIGQFNDSWGRWNLQNCLPTWEKYVELNTIFTSEYSTDESIRFGLRLMSTFIYAERHTSNDLWNWMRATSERIRNNEKWMKKTRDSASAVLYEMAMSENRWRSY